MSGNPAFFNATPQRVIKAYSDARTFYAVIVTAIPTNSWATLSDVTDKASGGSYTHKDLVKKVGTPALYGTNGAKLEFDNPTWSALYLAAATTLKGIIIVEGSVGASSGTDKIYNYNPLLNDLTPATVIGSAQDFTYNFDANGSTYYYPNT